MIDIHNHTLFGVDDGAKNIEEAVKMLSDAKQQGVNKIIFTPHYRRGMFSYPSDEIKANFERLTVEAGRLEMEVFLGCEYHVNSDIIENLKSGRCQTLAGSDYVLTEYSYQTEDTYIKEQTKRLLSCGYLPVIAHVERYKCLQKKPALCKELADMGAMIQINADSVLGIEGRVAEHFCKKLLKHEWADVIASDTHDMAERACHLKKCKTNIEKRYGNEYANQLFEKNPMRIIENR